MPNKVVELSDFGIQRPSFLAKNGQVDQSQTEQRDIYGTPEEDLKKKTKVRLGKKQLLVIAGALLLMSVAIIVGGRISKIGKAKNAVCDYMTEQYGTSPEEVHFKLCSLWKEDAQDAWEHSWSKYELGKGVENIEKAASVSMLVYTDNDNRSANCQVWFVKMHGTWEISGIDGLNGLYE